MEKWREVPVVSKQVVCSVCHHPIRKGAKAVVRQYRTGTMPASGFYYYHKKCAPKGWSKRTDS